MLPRSERRKAWLEMRRVLGWPWEGRWNPPVHDRNRHDWRKAVKLAKTEYRKGYWVRELGRAIGGYVRN